MLFIMILLKYTYSWGLNLNKIFGILPLQNKPIPPELSKKEKAIFAFNDVSKRVCSQGNNLLNSVANLFNKQSETDEQHNGTKEGEKTTVNPNSNTQGDHNNDNGSCVAKKSENEDNQPTPLSGLNESSVNTEHDKDIGNDSDVNGSTLTSDVTNENTSAHSSQQVNPDPFKDTKPKDYTNKAMVPNKEDPVEEVDSGNREIKKSKNQMIKLPYEVDKLVEKNGDSSTNASKVDNEDIITPKANNGNIQNQTSNEANTSATKANGEYPKKTDGSNEVSNTQNSDSSSNHKPFANNSDNNSNKFKKDKTNSSNSSLTQTGVPKLNQDKADDDLDVAEQDSTLEPKSHNVLNNSNTTQKDANASTAVTKANNNEDTDLENEDSWEIISLEEYNSNQALQNDDKLDNNGLLGSTADEKSNPDTKESKNINRPFNDDENDNKVKSVEDENLQLNTDTDKYAKLYKQKNIPLAHKAKNPDEVKNNITPNEAKKTSSCNPELLELELALRDGTIRKLFADKIERQAKSETKRE